MNNENITSGNFIYVMYTVVMYRYPKDTNGARERERAKNVFGQSHIGAHTKQWSRWTGPMMMMSTERKKRLFLLSSSAGRFFRNIKYKNGLNCLWPTKFRHCAVAFCSGFRSATSHIASENFDLRCENVLRFFHVCVFSCFGMRSNA